MSYTNELLEKAIKAIHEESPLYLFVIKNLELSNIIKKGFYPVYDFKVFSLFF